MIRKGKERREYPRLDLKLPVKVVANGYDFSTTTQNISCVGTYCRITKYVPPFTRVAIKMNLPITENQQKKDYQVECKGVIVRSEDESGGGFNIAVFFNEIKENQRKIISKYIKQFIPQENPVLA